MRVVQVSAHYPPDFVSGGTLVPQRIARHLAGRGHDVRVFAGSLEPGRRPLERWDEDDTAGVRITWLGVRDYTSWSDRRNFDHPEAVSVFEHWLSTVRPEVVHLHSIQTLGGGFVSAARASGARVVVTAHDFWWQCARQFLVDRGGSPCSLVTLAGVCACESGVAARGERSRWLADRLADADLVLCPSASAARVLVANGVPAERLRVDENGLAVPAESPGAVGGERPAPARPAPGPSVATGTRFLFAGGADPMKGWPVLREACELLASESDLAWSLTAHGVPGEELPRVPASRVVAQPRFAPAELAQVLREHDVLVLPSLMRETFSILTREALLAGLPVVTSDSLGPEEVVEHEVNGLVVTTGDAGSLAAAMRRLAAEPDLVARLAAKTSSVQVKAVAAQAESLEACYRSLLEPPAPAEPPRPRALGDTAAQVQRVLFVVGIDGAPLRYRALLPAEALRLVGRDVRVRHYSSPDLGALARDADAVVLYRVPATRHVVEVVRQVREQAGAVPLLFDVDDLIFDPTLRGRVPGLAGMAADEEELWWRGVARYRTTMELCDRYVGSTPTLVEHAEAVTGMPARLFPNGVSIGMGRVADAALREAREPGPLRLGYFSGTTTHNADWAVVEEQVAALMARHQELELWLGGHLTTGRALEPVSGRVRRLPLVPWDELLRLLRQVDVNLAPLVTPSLFNDAKSAIKWSEAALVGTPSVVSATRVMRDAVADGVSGVVVHDEGGWLDALDRLVSDPVRVLDLGARARRGVLLEYGPWQQAARYLAILADARAQVAEAGPRGADPGWVPVVDDEPVAPAVRGHHPGPGQVGEALVVERTRAAASPRLATVARRLREELARQGAVGTGVWLARKGRQEAGRRLATALRHRPR